MEDIVPSRPSHQVPSQLPASGRDSLPFRNLLVQAEQERSQSQVLFAI